MSYQAFQLTLGVVVDTDKVVWSPSIVAKVTAEGWENIHEASLVHTVVHFLGLQNPQGVFVESANSIYLGQTEPTEKE